MKVEIILNENIKEPCIKIETNIITNEIQKIADSLMTDIPNDFLIGIKDKKISILEVRDVVFFYSSNQYVYANIDGQTLIVKKKLYELEEIYKETGFIRISNSCIVNMKKVKNLKFSYTGTIEINFLNGTKEYVSRRYISEIKKYLGMWGERNG